MRITRPAPRGMATAIEAAARTPDAAHYVHGFLPARFGALYRSHMLWRLLTSGHRIIGLGFLPPEHLLVFTTGDLVWHYYCGVNKRGHLEIVRQGVVAVVPPDQAYSWGLGSLWDGRITGIEVSPFEQRTDGELRPHPKWVRGAVFGDEYFFVYAPASSLFRVTVDERFGVMRVRHCGYAPCWPEVSEVTDRVVDIPRGVPIGYATTTVDERLREGYISSTATITLSTSGNSAARVTLSWPEDGFTSVEAFGMYLYRTAAGTNTMFRCTKLRDVSGCFIGHNGLIHPIDPRIGSITVIDRTPESELVGNAMAPLPGQNRQFAPASTIAVIGNRLYATDRSCLWPHSSVGWAAMCNVQISPMDNPTVTSPLLSDLESDGGTLQVSPAGGGKLVAIGPLQGGVGLWKSNGLWLLSGAGPSTWRIDKIAADYGCVNPDTLAYVDDIPIWLSQAGVVALENGTPTVLSLPIDTVLRGPSAYQISSIEHQYAVHQWLPWVRETEGEE